jgi:hypothetical protein
VAATISFELDGRAVTVDDDGASLLEVLRDRLGERSPKDGCSPQGQCGCCTVLVDRAKDLSATVDFVHAEVYTDDTAKTTTDAVQTYGLTYEPALFLALPDGTIQGTLAYTYVGVELDAELSRIVQ